MYINSKIGMMFGPPQQRQLQPQPQVLVQPSVTTTPIANYRPRQRSFRPMLLGQTQKKGCRSCGS